MGGDSALVAELRRLERSRRTGVLRLGREGALYLADGAVVFAESPRTAGLERLVAASGHRVPEHWAEGAGEGDREAAAAALGQPMLETFALLSAFDAAYFLLGSAAEPRFREGPPHWLAQVCRITPATLVHEYRRRRDRLAAEGADRIERAPVVPVRRVRRQRVLLTGLQTELLVNADGRRTPPELARDLGRTAFGCLLAVRALAGAGLVEPPPPEPDLGDPPLPERRRAGPDGAPPAERWTPVDHDLLVRLRTALEELA
ncbi:hypothetical protein [Actinomadura hibisca]|uniref:hypothetical protein n=1 Tax=Actinomadura hibisca TaxID=68565 RepID=UPI00083579C6|nr:hypothetical protein [Actinomadura hibisca]